MNERIKLFAELAKNAIPAHLGSRVPIEFTEKFAELIVKECCQFENSYSGDARLVSRHYGRRIREHFGVEE